MMLHAAMAYSSLALIEEAAKILYPQTDFTFNLNNEGMQPQSRVDYGAVAMEIARNFFPVEWKCSWQVLKAAHLTTYQALKSISFKVREKVYLPMSQILAYSHLECAKISCLATSNFFCGIERLDSGQKAIRMTEDIYWHEQDSLTKFLLLVDKAYNAPKFQKQSWTLTPSQKKWVQNGKANSAVITKVLAARAACKISENDYGRDHDEDDEESFKDFRPSLEKPGPSKKAKKNETTQNTRTGSRSKTGTSHKSRVLETLPYFPLETMDLLEAVSFSETAIVYPTGINTCAKDIVKNKQAMDPFLLELEVYEHLIDMQGKEIPDLSKLGRTDGDMVFLEMQNAGTALAQPDLRDVEVQQSILSLVNKLHAAKICHGDLRPQNFCKNSSGLKIIDFGASTIHPLAKEIKQEKAELNKMFA